MVAEEQRAGHILALSATLPGFSSPDSNTAKTQIFSIRDTLHGGQGPDEHVGGQHVHRKSVDDSR